MPWQAWAVVIWLAVQAGIHLYYVDRPRKRKTWVDVVGAWIEIGLAMWAVIWLGTNFA